METKGVALGIDSSTQGISAIAIDLADYSVAAEASVRYRGDKRLAAFDLPTDGAPILPPRSPGEADQPVALYLASLEALLSDLGPELLARVAAVDLSAQQHGQVWVGAAGLDAMAGLARPRSRRAREARSCVAHCARTRLGPRAHLDELGRIARPPNACARP